MTELNDLQGIIEILSLAVACQQNEWEFFCRCAGSASNQEAKELFSELADEAQNYLQRLEQRRQKLLTAVAQMPEKSEGKK